MTTIYLYSFLSVLSVSLISFLGIFALSLREEVLRKYIFILISIAVGALLGDAFIHLIPEALENTSNSILVSTLVIGGVLLFFVIEKFLHWHHHEDDTRSGMVHPVGKLILFSDGVHNFLDGVIIAASFLVSIPVGLATTLAVVLHEIPQEVGDFAVLIHAGYTKKRALWLNFLSAISAILGVLVFFAVGERAQAASEYFLPIAAGGFIYIAVADLIPELHKNKGVKQSIIQILSVLLGVLAMIGLVYLD